MNSIVLSESKTHLLQYIRSLQYHCGWTDGHRNSLQGLSKDSGEWLPALHNIHSLGLANIRIDRLSEEELHGCFSAFRETLTDLTLGNFVTSFTAFVTLVDYFPNITALQLGLFSLEPDEGPVPSLSRPLRGKISIFPSHPNCFEFIDRLAMLDLEYEELVIEPAFMFEFARAGFLERILQFGASTVECLRLLCGPEREYPLRTVLIACSYSAFHLSDGATTVNHFQQLRVLELIPSRTCEVLFSSITSTEFRKIILQVFHVPDFGIHIQGIGMWPAIDRQLCEFLARMGRMGYSHTLQVELRVIDHKFIPKNYDLTGLLAKFREKGVVTVI